MWCTRWFLPLLLLPLPTAPPYFLLLFLFSLTMHAKPCFYCIVLLTTLFISSCYWQPFPLDSPLSTPWSDNITSFADALNSMLPGVKYSFPTVIHAVDRCWCDFSAGGFFEPFNVSHWEHISLQRLRDDLERKYTPEDLAQEQNETAVVDEFAPSSAAAAQMPTTSSPLPTTLSSKVWSLLYPLYFPRSDLERGNISAFSSSNHTPIIYSATEDDKRSEPGDPQLKLPVFRKEYDLRPHGLGIIIDFSWTQ